MLTTINLTPLVQALVALVSVVITVYLIPCIKANTTEKEQAAINQWVVIAVLAAEQIYKGSGMGEEKKQYVVDFLMEHNLTIDMDELNNMIESVVLKLNKGLL